LGAVPDLPAEHRPARRGYFALEWDCLPIINENDTVSVAEIRFGDNDHLAAMVTNLLQHMRGDRLSRVESLQRKG
jgi:hypothetical protein